MYTPVLIYRFYNTNIKILDSTGFGVKIQRPVPAACWIYHSGRKFNDRWGIRMNIKLLLYLRQYEVSCTAGRNDQITQARARITTWALGLYCRQGLLGIYGISYCGTEYELVQVKRRKFSPPRKPLALSNRMSHIHYHTDRNEQWMSGKGWHGHFVQGLKLALVSGENASPPTTVLEKGQ